MRFPTLDCNGCQPRIVLPYRRFLDSDVVAPYWPEESARLSWVCSKCLHCTSFDHDAIDWVGSGSVAAPHPERGFWRIGLACSEPACDQMIVAYTDTIGNTSEGKLRAAIAGATPVPRCRNGHEPGQQSTPEQIDFVEWTGAVEYLQ